MLTIVFWLWRDTPCHAQYTPEHANIAARMIHCNLTLPHRFVLLTDQMDADYDPLIEPMQLWDDWHDLRTSYWRPEFPQCYVRLKAFSPEMADILGPRFVSIDLDCVVVGNLDAILSRTEDFLICHRPRLKPEDKINRYQASMWMMNAGARESVWTDFDGAESLAALADREHWRHYMATDQGWMLAKLGKKEAGWNKKDGVYHWKWLQDRNKVEELPGNARIVFFNGRIKPWTLESQPSWVKENWQ
jgi:hypothetical protein